jgi:NAD(P)-dependent dehydrogenase (short-subunit alcohol dehydrogenase family)
MSDTVTNVVIGAGSGMGAAVARRLVDRGRLLVVDRDVDAVATLANELGSDVDAAACDITDDDQVASVVEATGTLGSLVLTAGLSPNMGSGRAILEVNLRGTDRVVKAFESILQPGSAALCFASMAAHQIPADPAVDAIVDRPDSPSMIDDLDGLGLVEHSGLAYAVSKRGVVRLVERRAGVWGERGARLLSLSPGIIDTPMGRLEDANEPAMAEMVATSALRREGQPDEIAAVTAFLVSPEASFMTGVDVLVDGGVIAHARSSG